MNEEQVKSTLHAWAWSLAKRAYLASRGTKSNAAGWGAIAVAVWQMGWADALTFATKDPATALVIGAWLLGQADKLARLLLAKWQARNQLAKP
jgi:hypothetical protein